ncbi:TPA: hypothetical protein ACS72K_000641 [Providencia alcalifaciens]
MSKNESWGNERFVYGYCDFENYWGEELAFLEISHSLSNLGNKNERELIVNTFENIESNKVIENALVFPFYKNIEGCNNESDDVNGYCDFKNTVDKWNIKFKTRSGKQYHIVEDCLCPLWYGDNDNNIKLGVDGNKKKFHINFSSYSGCAVNLIEVL